jgi:hypothetical protein
MDLMNVYIIAISAILRDTTSARKAVSGGLRSTFD